MVSSSPVLSTDPGPDTAPAPGPAGAATRRLMHDPGHASSMEMRR